jgi:hypothetical protein
MHSLFKKTCIESICLREGNVVTSNVWGTILFCNVGK